MTKSTKRHACPAKTQISLGIKVTLSLVYVYIYCCNSSALYNWGMAMNDVHDDFFNVLLSL